MTKLNIIFIIGFLLNIEAIGQVIDKTGKPFTPITISNIDCIKDKDIPCSFSGLTWHNNDLILMPQYPNFPTSVSIRNVSTLPLEGSFFKISKHKLENAVKKSSTTKIKAKKLAITVSGTIKNTIQKTGHEGYEAILFDGEVVYALVELVNEEVSSVLIQGTIKKNRIDFTKILKHFDRFSGIEGMAKEAMTLVGSDIMVFDEVNCECDNGIQKADLFSPQGMGSNQKVEMPKIENRITDATSLDPDGNFWVSNFLYYDDGNGVDSEILEICKSNTSNSIQQIHELHYDLDSKAISKLKTIKINFADTLNWEGIARLGPSHLLLINDDLPSSKGETKFGYIKLD